MKCTLVDQLHKKFHPSFVCVEQIPRLSITKQFNYQEHRPNSDSLQSMFNIRNAMDRPTSDNDKPEFISREEQESSYSMSIVKFTLSALFLLSSVSLYRSAVPTEESSWIFSSMANHRKLTQIIMGDTIPAYIQPLLEELKGRKKLMEETPPEEVKYWFEYTGPLQVRKLRFLENHVMMV
jgi:hypothetical protein